MSAVVAANVALLAPVPLEHLLDGRTTLLAEGKVAFGSRAYERFLQLDELRKGMPVDVYIYESHSDGHHDFRVSWHARYTGFVKSEMGAHPHGMRFRPASTAKYTRDNSGYWAVFWEVDSLEQIPEEKRRHVGDFTGFGKKKAYGDAFSPEGPLLIEHP